MSEITNIALDAMGGDYAPVEMVKGAVDAIQKESAMKVFLVGQEDKINEELEKYQYNKEQIEVVPASEAVSYTHLDVYKRQLQRSVFWRCLTIASSKN